MSKVIFSESVQTNNSRIGKLVEPIQMFIQNESDEMTKSKGYETTLFKTDTSDNWAEAFVTSDNFGMWGARSEGGVSPVDSMGETMKKVIEHSEYGKGFVITKKMMDDMSNKALGLRANEMAKQFVDSYHQTKNYAMVQALANGGKAAGDLIEGKYILVAGNKIDVTTADNKPLFAKDHVGGKEELHGTFNQSNYFYTTDKTAIDKTTGSGAIALLLDQLSVIGRNMKDENGRAMGYAYDTVIIPGDNYLLEQLVRRALGSDRFPGTQINDICTQFGTKNLLVLPEWTSVGEANPHQFMLMSSKAKENLHGNQLLERVPMDVKNWIDNPTRSWMWDGYARYGIGFPTYKHILRMVIDTAGTMSALATDIATA